VQGGISLREKMGDSTGAFGEMRWRALALVLMATLLWPGAASATQSDEPVVRRAIESNIELDPGRQATRLPRVSLDDSNGDLTVIFAMRRPPGDDPAQIVAFATDDVFTILWAVYASGSAQRIRTVTVLGTYAVVGRYARPREIPIMRAVLTAERAASLDWTTVVSADPRNLLDVWWVEGELGG
jgi:hypothetical protein